MGNLGNGKETWCGCVGSYVGVSCCEGFSSGETSVTESLLYGQTGKFP